MRDAYSGRIIYVYVADDECDSAESFCVVHFFFRLDEQPYGDLRRSVANEAEDCKVNP